MYPDPNVPQLGNPYISPMYSGIYGHPQEFHPRTPAKYHRYTVRGTPVLVP